MTEPLEPITFPYLTTEYLTGEFPQILFAAINNLSEVSLVAPYKLIGEQALSVDKATTLFTPVSNDACITFCAPNIFVFINSSGFYSAIGTCFNAAA